MKKTWQEIPAKPRNPVAAPPLEGAAHTCYFVAGALIKVDSSETEVSLCRASPYLFSLKIT